MGKMDRKVKYALQLGTGVNVRTIKELRDNFDFFEVYGYFVDKKLNEWLEDRHHTDILKKIESLKSTDEDFSKKFCEALEVPWDPSYVVNFREQEAYEAKEDKVKQITSDEEALSHIKDLAYDQKELENLLTLGKHDIYLLGKDEKGTQMKYELPINFNNRKFIGVDGEPLITFRKELTEEEISRKELVFQNVQLEDIVEIQDSTNGLISPIKNILNIIFDAKGQEKKEVNCTSSRLPRQKKYQETNSIQDVQDKLVRYSDAGFPIILFTTFEEDKADEIIASIAGGRHVLEWSVRGFWNKAKKIRKDDWDLNSTLKFMIQNPEELSESILVLKDFHALLDDYSIVARLKYIAQSINMGDLVDTTIIMVSPIRIIPKELENYITIVNMGYLSQREIKKIITDYCKKQDVQLANEELKEELSVTFKGLSEFEICNILALALSDDGEITRADLSLIFEQKKQVIEKSDVLEMITVKDNMNDVGGLENLKEWLKNKATVFRNISKAREFGVDIPKGVLIAGMPGCGKSLSAKAAANLFGMPLLRMDMGRLMGKYVGESEANMRKAVSLAEAISPCVFWIDEMEKAFAGVGSDGAGTDVTTRLFGTFLTWLQENESLAFVVATANDITKMPPELLRKGRFDEVFYIGMPNHKERENIFRIHILKRRPQDLKYIDLLELADKTNGFSGADIEGVVRDAVESAFISKAESLSTELLLQIIKKTNSLSEMMSDSIKDMEELYKNNKLKNASN